MYFSKRFSRSSFWVVESSAARLAGGGRGVSESPSTTGAVGIWEVEEKEFRGAGVGWLGGRSSQLT